MDLHAALAIAREAHAGAVDKAGRPYIEHIERVVARLGGEEERIVAALHDVVEDTDLGPEELRAAGLPERMLEAVLALTRRDGESYEDFVARAATDPLARAVKRADVLDNSDEKRLRELPRDQRDRLRSKYSGALAALDKAP